MTKLIVAAGKDAPPTADQIRRELIAELPKLVEEATVKHIAAEVGRVQQAAYDHGRQAGRAEMLWRAGLIGLAIGACVMWAAGERHFWLGFMTGNQERAVHDMERMNDELRGER